MTQHDNIKQVAVRERERDVERNLDRSMNQIQDDKETLDDDKPYMAAIQLSNQTSTPLSLIYSTDGCVQVVVVLVPMYAE